MTKTPAMRLWELETGHRLEDVMIEANDLGFMGVAAKYGIPYQTLIQWKRRMGVTIRYEVVVPGASK